MASSSQVKRSKLEASESEDEEMVPVSATGSASSSSSRAVGSQAQATDVLPWVEKYRPSKLDDLISHEHILQTINTLIDKDRLPHLLLYGPPGTGKTSTILACAQRLYGSRSSNMVLELNASDDRGIGVVRNEIKSFASSRQLFSTGFKLVILDEADAMTSTAQFALRRVMEKYTSSTRFCLICNYINKIIPALQSRCTRFRFGPLESAQIEGRLAQIAEAERVALQPDGLRAIIKLAKGDMRKCLNILQACSTSVADVVGTDGHTLTPGLVDETAVYNCTGNPLPSDVREIFRRLMADSIPDTFGYLAELQRTKGISLVDIITEVHEQVIMAKMPAKMKIFLLKELADVESNLAKGTSERLQLGALVGMFFKAREMAAQLADRG